MIYVLGSSNTDLVLKVPRLPRPGETVTGARFASFRGGKGANQATACARAGAEGSRVSFHGGFGDDDYGAGAREALRREGIDVTSCQVIESCSSGLAFLFVDAAGENMIAVAPGANHALDPELAVRALSAIDPTDILLVSLELSLATVRGGLAKAHERGALTILNPAPIPAAGFPMELLEYVDILTPNETELPALVPAGPIPEDLGPEECLRQLAAEHALDVVLTRGAAGALAAIHVEGAVDLVHQAAFEVEAVDTVGAGDALNGALAVATSEGRPWPERLRFACAGAALAVTREGAQPSMPQRTQIETLLASQ